MPISLELLTVDDAHQRTAEGADTQEESGHGSGDKPRHDAAAPRGRDVRASANPAFERVILPHLDAAYNLARWLARDPSTAEEIVQDALLRALQYFASFRGGDGRAWLLQIVRNTTYSTLKPRHGGPKISLGSGTGAGVGMDVPDPGPDPEATLTQRQDLAQLEVALAALPIEQRECLVLRELEDFTYKEIAHIAGVPVGTVMSRLWRARQALMCGFH